MRLYTISMGRSDNYLFIWNIMWIIRIYPILCESSYNNTLVESTTKRVNIMSEAGVYSYLTVFLCHCNQGEIMNSSGVCQPYEGGTIVPTRSYTDSAPELIDTKEFNIQVHELKCPNPQVYLYEDEFVIWLQDPTFLQVIDCSYKGLNVLDYCVHHQWNQAQGKIQVTAKGCHTVPIVPRCCQMGGMVDNCESVNGTNTTLEFNPPLATGKPVGDNDITGDRYPWDFQQVNIATWSCEAEEFLEKIELDGKKAALLVRPNITWITWRSASSHRKYGRQSKYCVDLVEDENKYYAYVCQREKSYYQIIQNMVFPACFGLSSGFLALLLLLHAWIPKLRENEGRCQLFHASSLLVAHSLNWMFVYLKQHGFTFPRTCVPLALLMHFSYQSAFFWLNVMCFDVWKNFRKLVKNPYSPISFAPLWKNMLYAFGGPFTISVVTIVVQFAAPRDGSIVGLIHPRIGDSYCWFEGLKEAVPYHYVSITILYVLNIIFIGNTYYCLKILQRGLVGDIVVSKDIKSRTTNQFKVFWQQLYLLMLLSGLWLTEILSLIIPPKELWIPTDIMNTLQGVFIFFLFLMNDKKRRYLKEYLPKLLKFTNIWIDETDAAQVDINIHNPGIAKRKSPARFLYYITSTTSFKLATSGKNGNTTPHGITPISIIQKDTVPLDHNIHPSTSESI